jgi:hypothetical protein
MKHHYLLLFLVVLTSCTWAQEVRPFGGNWYVGSEVDIFTNRTRMVSGDLAKYTPSNSGIQAAYGLKVGHEFSPYLSIESGFQTLPMKLVYLYGENIAPKIVGTSALQMWQIPIRFIGQIYIFHPHIQAFVSVGGGYINTSGSVQSSSFRQSQVVATDTILFFGETNVLRPHGFYGELGGGLSWVLSRRVKLSIYGRQMIGMVNVAKTYVTARQNLETPDKAEFVGSGSGLQIGINLQYQFRIRK